MPLYEYRCSDCGNEFEMMMRFSEADRRPECPACESLKTQKKLSAVASFGQRPRNPAAAAAHLAADFPEQVDPLQP